ncbi:MAG: phosphonate ABC transporter permease [Epulopiscium sp. Nele67-Bin002]|nr:MAG: phosphonate ABC transporter, permease protein PhnE [Epulopiscium sp. Nuni2H_MBin001]OON91884.1 MAG: phosphonate ABC transporter permease [Epulopiscium sp. Nele67-Bin002]OON91955.1 MAG: phosphonate ABC transporter, permease protein PhnE [Epulopiscium sp. Nele67-Bin001]
MTIQQQLELEPNYRRNRVIISVVVIALMFWSATTLNFSNFSINGFSIARSIINGLVNPDWAFLFNATPSGVPYLLIETVAIAFLGTIVGAILAIPLSFLSATNLIPKPIAWIFRTVIMVIRTVPVFIYGLVFVRVAGPGAFAGLLTMSFASIGMVSKLYIESIEDLDIKVLEALDACGCNTFQKIRFGIIPQLIPDFASTVIYRFDMNLRDATVLGLVGAGGIGAPLIFAMNAYRWSEVSSILLGLVVLVLIVEFFSAKVRTKLVRG